MQSFKVDDVLKEMQSYIIPEILESYFDGKKNDLKDWTTLSTYATMEQSIDEREKAMHLFESKIGDIKDLKLLHAKLLEKNPVLVISFTAEQANVLRDKNGKVLEGKEGKFQPINYVMSIAKDSSSNKMTEGWKVLDLATEPQSQNKDQKQGQNQNKDEKNKEQNQNQNQNQDQNQQKSTFSEQQRQDLDHSHRMEPSNEQQQREQDRNEVQKKQINKLQQSMTGEERDKRQKLNEWQDTISDMSKRQDEESSNFNNVAGTGTWDKDPALENKANWNKQLEQNKDKVKIKQN